MIHGASVPTPPTTEVEVTTAAYDTLSDAIRCGDPLEVEAAWRVLDDLLRSGVELPTPWKAARPPRPQVEG